MTADWCLMQYVARLEGLMVSSTLEELGGHALLPAELSRDSWASLKELSLRSRLCTNTWNRMTKLC